ncbi:MAG: SCO family protein [Acidimicrobiales bacterium]|nr:SCO family protein [Acidimicrobiales bacterium]
MALHLPSGRPSLRRDLPTGGHLDRRAFLGLGAAGLAAAGLAGCSLGKASAPDTSKEEPVEGDWGGELIEPGLERPDVTLTTMDGEPFPFREATEGEFAILFFGYTSCPDVCPIYLNTLAKALETIGTGEGGDPMVLFVGVDTARDTPERLQEYLGAIDGTFIGLTGSDADIAEANRQMLLPPITLEEPDENGDYLVGHYGKAFPFTADGLAHRSYGWDVRQQQWVKDLPRLAEGTYE